jgi:NADPH:quinone reductase-like Zn-dependent oxidoreductase
LPKLRNQSLNKSVKLLGSFAPSMASREGLTELARLLAAGAITTRITTTEPLANAGALVDRLRHGGVRGKAVIHT